MQFNNESATIHAMALESLLGSWLPGGITDVFGMAMKSSEATALRNNVGAQFPSLRHKNGYKVTAKTAADFVDLPFQVSDRAQFRIIHNVASSHHTDLGSVGGVGCAIGHLLMWKEAALRKKGWTVIFEWDCVLDSDAATWVVKEIVAGPSPGENVGMLRMMLGTTVPTENVAADQPHFSRNLHSQCGLIMYIISNKWANWYVKRLSVVDMHIDWALNFTALLNGPEMWFLRPKIGFCGAHTSGTFAGVNMRLLLPDTLKASNAVCLTMIITGGFFFIAFLVTLGFCIMYSRRTATGSGK